MIFSLVSLCRLFLIALLFTTEKFPFNGRKSNRGRYYDLTNDVSNLLLSLLLSPPQSTLMRFVV